jgi:lipoprotein signal peptidase
MKKKRLGEIMLFTAVIMIIIAGVSIWMHLFNQGISSSIFLIALILAGARANLLKRGK